MLAMLEDLLIVQYRCGKTQTKSFLSYFSFQENSVSLQRQFQGKYIFWVSREDENWVLPEVMMEVIYGDHQIQPKKPLAAKHRCPHLVSLMHL